MKIGFTGTQKGMTKAQEHTLSAILWTASENKDITEFHHGDCVGADAQAHNLIDGMGLHDRIVIHPPTNSSRVAFKPSLKILEPKPYLERNHDIVDACDVLLACPSSMVEQRRSGTWATIRYAKKVGKSYMIIYPDGTSRYFPSTT